MKRFKFNTQSNTIAAYCVIVFAICLLLVALVFKYNTFLYYFNKLIKVLAPVIWGLVIAYLLNPIMAVFERNLKKIICRKREHPALTRGMSIAFSLIMMLGIIMAIVGTIVPEILTTLEIFFKSLPSYLNNLQIYFTEMISSILEKNPEIYDYLTGEFDNIQQFILDGVNKLEPMINKLLAKDGIVASLTGSAWSLIIGLKDCLLGIIVSIYLLYSKEIFIAQATKIVYALFSEKRRNKILKIASKTNHTFAHFISGKALDSFIIGVITFVGMNFMGLKNYAMLISVIIGITNMIPFFGPFIGAVPSGLLILLTSPEKTIIFIVFIFLLQQFDGNILGPKILGNSLGLSAFWIMFAIFVGGGLFGFVGMIAVVPIFAVLYSIIREVINTKLERKRLPVSTGYYRELNSYDDTDSD
ncbi:AI-2E family transporter, partial [Porcipelethomonas sp.]|uniref:AI-2E family transporter n=1 Tax=Porcipelethomonas sp. TaxID=2981675 RepID=UPI003EFB02E8